MSETILITGANRGIGLEFVRQYAEAGARVFAACRNPEAAHELNKLAAAHADRVSVHPLDVVNDAQRKALGQALAGTPIDIVINNAGVYGTGANVFGELDEQVWLKTLHTNTIAPIKMAEVFVDNVAASDRKIIATISSKVGSIADNSGGGSYGYRSSKSAVNMAMKSLSIELKDRGISCVTLHPGWVQTEMGGSNALITVEQSVSMLRNVLAGVDQKDNGKYFDKDGSIIPW